MSARSGLVPVVGLVASVALVLVAACGTVDPGPAGAGPEGHSLPHVSAPIGEVDSAYVLASKVVLPTVKPIEAEGLHNVFRLSDNVVSGSEPDGDAAFAKIAAMGVKTVVSVDGKAPDVETAARHGLRYVHIPIEYKAVSEEEMLELTKTFRELEGPFYAHCFHGKHRGPAAAAVARLVLDGISREEAIAEMRQWCGTAPEYEGLYHAVATMTIPDEATTSAFAFDFAPRRGLEGFRVAMIDVSRRHDALKKLSAHEWAADPSHPDFDATNEAVKLADTFAVARKMAEVATRPADFQGWLDDSVKQSAELRDFLKALHDGDAGALEPSKKAFAALTATCTSCHAVYRNR